MAPTKRKRRSTKHRGNALGQIEARGRTGRKPTEQERKTTARQDARQARADRLNRPPTWRSATNRAALAALVFFALIVLALGQAIGPAIAIALLMLLVYIPMGFYTDLAIYKRRMRKQGMPDESSGLLPRFGAPKPAERGAEARRDGKAAARDGKGDQPAPGGGDAAAPDGKGARRAARNGKDAG